jgi:hypothetical protein
MLNSNFISFGGRRRQNKPSTLLAVRYSSSVRIYNPEDWSVANTFAGLSCGSQDNRPPAGLEISPDNSFFVTAGTNGFGAYSMTDGSQLYFFSNTNNCRPVISKDGAYIAHGVGNEGGDFYVIDTTDWSLVQNVTSPLPSSGGKKQAFAFSHDGTKVAVASREFVRIIKTSNWSFYSNEFSVGSTTDVNDIQFSVDDSMLATATPVQDITADVIDVTTVSPTMTAGDVFTASLTNNDSRGCCWTHKGDLLVAACEGVGVGTVSTFNTSDFSQASSSPALSCSPTVISPSNNSEFIAVAGSAGFSILNTDDLSVVAGTPTELNSNAIYGIAWDHP